MAGFSCFIVALLALVAFADANSGYCRLALCKGKRGPHTMCKYTSPRPGPNCLEYLNVPMTAQEKREVLDLHNKLRRRVASGQETRGNQPRGNIPDLKWDDELAEVAQRWAHQCEFNHDACRNVDRFSVGQNIAYSASTSKDDGYHVKMSDLVMQWYDEVDYFDPRAIHPFQFISEAGHYSQLVWGATTHIGCGIARYLQRIPDENGQLWNYYSTQLICNYGPAGNMIGGRMYETY